MVIQPQGNFTVVRQISNHLDTGTYYCRAVIRNAYTDAVIETLDLALKGSQRYSKNWRATADTSGQGFYISIVTSVYTDSGYTSKSENYGDEEKTYLVQERVLGSLKSGGGLDMRTTRRIMEESLEKIKFPEQEKISIPKQKEYDDKFNTISKELTSIKDLIGTLPTENTNLSPVVSRLNELAQEVKTKPITPETDLLSLTEKINNLEKENKEDRIKLKEFLETLETKLTKVMKETAPEVMKNANFSIPMTVTPKEEVKKQFNINNLAK